jgi:hypothetical protein
MIGQRRDEVRLVAEVDAAPLEIRAGAVDVFHLEIEDRT